MDLKDKVAVIAGGSGAIGAASARRLAQAGAENRCWLQQQIRPGRCDVLVNSAGFTRIPHHDLEALTDELIELDFRRERARAVCNNSSICAVDEEGGGCGDRQHFFDCGDRRHREQHPYGGSKAALDTMALSLARILGPEIRVLTISPAAVDTTFVPGRTTAMVEKVASTTPLKRVVQADGVAQAVMAAVVNLTSTTGWIIPVDGGKLVG